MLNAVPMLLLTASNVAMAAGSGEHTVEISPIWVIPFLGMLLSIAVLPMVAHHWWERNRNQLLVSGMWAAPILCYFGYLIFNGDPGHVASHGLTHAVEEQGVDDFRNYYAREIAMLGLAGLSIWKTDKEIRKANGFTYGPILEVAALFCGIFITMIPATILLQAEGAALGINEHWQYFWATGFLSSFLDNAPNYVTFAALACGSIAECTSPEALGPLAQGTGQPLLVAISLGAVFMGANSYIGNGPNFMVRAIAEENGYKMTSFFGYMGWAALILLPMVILVTFIYLL